MVVVMTNRLTKILVPQLRRSMANACPSALESNKVNDPSTRYGKWQVASLVILERMPIVAPPMDDTQRKFHEYMTTLEFEKSLLSDHELRGNADKKRLERLAKKQSKESQNESLSGEETVAALTAQDFEELALAELKSFVTAPLETADDKKNDMKSLNRSLDRKLLFVARLKLSQNPAWWLPFAVLKPEENLRQAAERALKELVNDEENFTFYGNAPIGFHKHRFAKPIKKSTSFDGVKLFFYKATTNSMALKVKSNEKLVDYQWITHESLKSVISSLFYRRLKPHLFE